MSLLYHWHLKPSPMLTRHLYREEPAVLAATGRQHYWQIITLFETSLVRGVGSLSVCHRDYIIVVQFLPIGR